MSKLSDHPLFTSRSEEYRTPQELFDRLDEMFGFTLDPCAAPWNAKCEKYYTIEDNGLEQSWQGETVFMNPPYGRNIADWMEKAYTESKNNDATVVVLVHSRTDTRWWHDWAMKANQIWFIKGRLSFDNPDGEDGYKAPFPSCILVYQENSPNYMPVPAFAMDREGNFLGLEQEE